MIKLTRRQTNHLTRRDKLGEHVGDLKLRMLKIGDPRVELLSVLDVVHRINNRLLSGTDRARRNVNTAAIQPLHCN